MSLKTQILALAGKAKTKEVKGLDIKGLYVKEYSAGDREQIENLITQSQKSGTIRATIFVKSACDKDGVRLFDDNDIDKINELPVSLVNAVFDESNKLNGITDDHEKN